MVIPWVNHILSTQRVLSNFIFPAISRAYNLMWQVCVDNLKMIALKNKIQMKFWSVAKNLKHTCDQNISLKAVNSPVPTEKAGFKLFSSCKDSKGDNLQPVKNPLDLAKAAFCVANTVLLKQLFYLIGKEKCRKQLNKITWEGNRILIDSWIT